MAPKWTSERDQHLLLLIIGSVKINFQEVAESWAATFPNESFHPTKKAIEEHVRKLKRDMKAAGVSTGVITSTPKSAFKRTPASKRVSAIKTPASGKKRNFTSMSDEEGDDDDDEGFNMSTPLPKRQMTSRRSKSVTGKYAGLDSSADEDEDVATKEEESDDGLEAAFASVKAATTGASLGGLNGSGNHEPKSRDDSVVGARRSPSKSKRVSLDEQSDVSEFDPSA